MPSAGGSGALRHTATVRSSTPSTSSLREQLVARSRGDSVFILEESQPERVSRDQEAELCELVEEDGERLGSVGARAVEECSPIASSLQGGERNGVLSSSGGSA